MENIISYANGHRNTKRVALSASEAGIGMLNDMQEKLYFAGNELQRMENESGKPLNDEQTEMADAYSRASQRIKTILFVARNIQPSIPASQQHLQHHKEV